MARVYKIAAFLQRQQNSATSYYSAMSIKVNFDNSNFAGQGVFLGTSWNLATFMFSSQLTATCSISTIETLHKGVKYVQS